MRNTRKYSFNSTQVFILICYVNPIFRKVANNLF